MSVIHKRFLALPLFAWGLSITADAQDTSRLRSAAVSAALTSARSCEVTMALETTTSGEVDHRLEAPAGTDVELVAVHGAETGSTRQIGSTRSLVVRPVSADSYQIHYRVTQPAERAFRCPLWLPAVPTDGRPRAVTIKIALPEGSSPAGSSFPAFSWDAAGGTATLAHVPAFIRVPYAGSGTGEAAGLLDIGRAMDAVAIALLALATAGWVWRRRRV